MSKYQLEGTISATVAGKTFSVLHAGPADISLTSLPDAIASIEVGKGIQVNGTAVLQGAGQAETLDLTLSDNIPGLPSSLVDTVSLKGAPLLVSEGIELAEHFGLLLAFEGTITKVPA